MDKYITTTNPQRGTDFRLYVILVSMQKEQLLRIARRLDLWVNPNYAKAKTAERLAEACGSTRWKS